MSNYSSDAEQKKDYKGNKTIGTRGALRTWLTSMKGMTYTKYSTLPIPQKAEIMEEYTKKQQTSRSTVIVTAKKVENSHVL
jgi:hypothetical protein